MPPVSKTSSSSAKPRAKKAARKTTSAKASTRTKATKAKASRAKAARTRATHQAESAVRQTQAATRETADVFGDYAERAVLIPVGAALVARDKVVSTVSDTISTYSSPAKAQAQLRRFERRGVTARNRLEREVRKARVRFERELRQRRRELEKSVSDLDSRRENVAKQVPDIANRVPELANRVQERILSLV
jgi:hypothetical protein